MARRLLVCACIAVATAAVYAQTLDHGFISFDDKKYVSENDFVLQGLSWEGVQWAFSSFGYASNWHPLTWISHMLDVSIFGPDRPDAYHAVNVVLHALAAALLFLLLERATRALWASAFVAALFALHPMHVESVAWIAERKDVLSAVFWMLTIWAYVVYAQSGRRGAYGFALVAFALGVLAKPVMVTLPFVLLLLDVWPLERSRSFGRLLAEKLPFLLLAVISAAATYVAQDRAIATLQVGLVDSVGNALVSYVAYLGKLAWPAGLSVFYPHPNGPGQEPLAAWQVLGAFAVLAAVSAGACLGAMRGRRYLLVGWLWYLGTLVPMIGVVQVGRAAMADRYTYISAIGLFIMLAWSAGDLVRAGKLPAWLSGSLAVVILAACGMASHRQAALWSGDFSLFGHAASVTRNNSLAHALLGIAYANRDDPEAAKRHLQLAVEIDPEELAALDILGRIHVKEGHTDLAIPVLTRAVALQGDDARTRYFLARSLLAEGRREEAMPHLLRSVELPSEIETESRARRLLAREYEREGRVGEAAIEYRWLLDRVPDSVVALTRLAWIHATDPELRDAANALAYAAEACRLTSFEQARPLDALAAAYAAGGDFVSAVATAESALGRMAGAPAHQRAEAQARLDAYRRGEMPRAPAIRR